MKLRDLAEETYTGLAANKVRSGLTMLGIVIGIAAVIAMVSIGQGAQNQIQSSIEGLGSNLLTVFPGAIQPGRGLISSGRGSAQTLKNPDYELASALPNVAAVSPESNRRFQISANGNNTNSTVIGALPEYEMVHNTAVADGAFIGETQVRSLARVAVLGPTVANDLFGDRSPIGADIRINHVNFKVIGLFQAKGGSGFFNPDDAVFIPLSTMQKVLAGVDYLSSMAVSVDDKSNISTVSAALTVALAQNHRISPDAPDFSIISQQDILGTLTQITDTFTLFLAAIASISLVVGGIGIMNMMLTTVTERTREIGLRKAIGAKRRDISWQFLAEAVLLTFLGGLIGVLLGSLISWIVSHFAGLSTAVSLSAVLLAFGVSAAIGIIFGYYPARRAAWLNPIEALRYE